MEKIRVCRVVLVAILVLAPGTFAKAKKPPIDATSTHGHIEKVISLETPLTLNEALRQALINNPHLRAATTALDETDAAKLTAKAYPNPQFLSDNGVAEATYRVGVGQIIELGGKRGKRMAVADARHQVALSQWNQKVLDLRKDVRQAYCELYYAQEEYTLWESLAEQDRQMMEATQERLDTGDVSELSLLMVKLKLAQAQEALMKAKYQVDEGRHHLAALLNRPISPSTVLAPPTIPDALADSLKSPSPQASATYPAPDTVTLSPDHSDTGTGHAAIHGADPHLESWIQLAFRHRPDWQVEQSNTTLYEAQEYLIKANRVPDVSLTAGPDIVTGPGGGVNVFATAALEIPLWNRQQGPLAEIRAKQNTTQSRQQALRTHIVAEVEHAYLNVEQLQRRVSHMATTLLPTAKTIVQRYFEGVSLGHFSVETALTQQSMLIGHQLHYLDRLSELQNAISTFEATLGTPLSE